MPAPSSQNFRSAPQKQPIPNIAVSKPAGYGPFNGRPKMKCSSAVGSAAGRPLRAVSRVGISVFFLENNILTPEKKRLLPTIRMADDLVSASVVTFSRPRDVETLFLPKAFWQPN
jgi:hypothetical protein